MMRVDVHQHIWTAPLLGAVAARDSLPYVRRRDGLTVLHAGGERPFVIDVDAESADRRTRLLHAEGLELALIALSSPIGIEALAREAANELIKSHLEGVAALGDGFAAWGPVALDRPDPDDVDELLDRGCLGISLPAGALADIDGLDAIGPLLGRVAARGVPLFVHPGPAPGHGRPEASPSEPTWWRAMTDYVAQMQAAWLCFATRCRPEHPELVVVFAMLAGGAPLLSERLATRGGPEVDLRDPRMFYDTSSYGPAAVRAMRLRVGRDQLVYGSDRPVVEPVRGEEDERLQLNGARFAAQIVSAS
jgi:6-methylsalicylate decarboxylase